MGLKQFDVHMVDLNPTKGSEINKKRPAVIVSPDVMNKYLSTVIVAPLTSTIKIYPTRVPSNFLGKSGEVALDQIRSVDKARLSKTKTGRVSATMQSNIKAVLKTMFS